MTPKEKSKELIVKFRDDKFTSQITTAGAKQCALICVEEILKICPAADAFNPWREEPEISFVEYWEQVKQSLKDNQ